MERIQADFGTATGEVAATRERRHTFPASIIELSCISLPQYIKGL
jgi:hypothetical protein